MVQGADTGNLASAADVYLIFPIATAGPRCTSFGNWAEYEPVLQTFNHVFQPRRVLLVPNDVPRFHSFDLIGNRVFCFAGKTEAQITDLYILETAEGERRWKRPLYEGQLNCRAHASAILHDKLIIFGGVRDRRDSKDVIIEQKISKKLFFLNVLAIKDGVSEGTSSSAISLVCVCLWCSRH